MRAFHAAMSPFLTALGARILASWLWVFTVQVGISQTDFGKDSGAGAQASASALAYDAAVLSKQNAPLAVHNGVDLNGRAWDFAKSLIGKAELSIESSNKVERALLDAGDFWASAARQGMSIDDLNRFVVKRMLESLDQQDAVRIKTAFNLGSRTTKPRAAKGGLTGEGAARAVSGEAEGDTRAAPEAALLDAIDSSCPQCVKARDGLRVALEGANLVETWMRADTTRAQYQVWKKDKGAVMTVAGGAPWMGAVRRALEAGYESQGRKIPPTQQELERFVNQQFEAWKRAEDAVQTEVNVLRNAREAYLALTDEAQRSFGGTTEQGRAAAFCSVLLPIYRQVDSVKGDRPLPPGGGEGLVQEAVALARTRVSDGEGVYNDRLLEVAGKYGWLVPIPAGKKGAITGLLAERLSHLSYEKLKMFLDYAAVNQTEAFYGCLCSRLPGVGLAKEYKPNGAPCHLRGLGEWWDPFPTDPEAWTACLAQTAAGGKSFANSIADRVAGESVMIATVPPASPPPVRSKIDLAYDAVNDHIDSLKDTCFGGTPSLSLGSKEKYRQAINPQVLVIEDDTPLARDTLGARGAGGATWADRTDRWGKPLPNLMLLPFQMPTPGSRGLSSARRATIWHEATHHIEAQHGDRQTANFEKQLAYRERNGAYLDAAYRALEDLAVAEKIIRNKGEGQSDEDWEFNKGENAWPVLATMAARFRDLESGRATQEALTGKFKPGDIEMWPPDLRELEAWTGVRIRFDDILGRFASGACGEELKAFALRELGKSKR